jgi:RHS repeat-associated protein
MDPQTGQETGLYYYRARYMDTVQGRFLQRDPLGYRDGLNVYEYVRGRPVNGADPSGQDYAVTLPCGRFNLTNTQQQNAVRGQRSHYRVTITFEPTQRCCCCKQIKMLQLVQSSRLERGTFGGEYWEPVQLHGMFNQSEHYGSDRLYKEWKVDTNVQGNPYGDGLTGSCQPRINAQLNDDPGINQGGWRFRFFTCAICDSGPEKGQFYGCITWGFQIRPNGELVEGFESFYKLPETFNNDPAVKAWNANEARQIPTAKPCCKD